MNAAAQSPDVVRIGAQPSPCIRALVERYGARLELAPPGADLPGSYWGDSEAGLRGDTLHVRADTPLHSLLHELSHYVCMSADRRQGVDRDAGGDDAEECAVCYLQIVLAGAIPDFGRDRMLADMDAWGYTFRLGSARGWFEEDSVDACIWLARHGVIVDDRPTYRLRA
jgi:hypothetical protein